MERGNTDPRLTCTVRAFASSHTFNGSNEKHHHAGQRCANTLRLQPSPFCGCALHETGRIWRRTNEGLLGLPCTPRYCPDTYPVWACLSQNRFGSSRNSIQCLVELSHVKLRQGLLLSAHARQQSLWLGRLAVKSPEGDAPG